MNLAFPCHSKLSIIASGLWRSAARLQNFRMGLVIRLKKTSFDIDKFEKTRLELHEHEEKLLQSLIEYVGAHYKKIWSNAEAKEYLSTFLDKEGYGAELFLKRNLNSIKAMHPHLYILAGT